MSRQNAATVLSGIFGATNVSSEGGNITVINPLAEFQAAPSFDAMARTLAEHVGGNVAYNRQRQGGELISMSFEAEDFDATRFANRHGKAIKEEIRMMMRGELNRAAAASYTRRLKRLTGVSWDYAPHCPEVSGKDAIRTKNKPDNPFRAHASLRQLFAGDVDGVHCVDGHLVIEIQALRRHEDDLLLASETQERHHRHDFSVQANAPDEYCNTQEAIPGHMPSLRIFDPR